MRPIFVLVGILGGVIPALAQTTQLSPFGDLIVVTASLEEEERQELPSSVEVIDHQEIEARQATSIAELLATATGATVLRSGSAGQVTSLFSRGTESDQTLVLWNGVELNNPFFGGFNWAFLPADGVERVEVARGPFSSLYGGDALGGVVQILSRSDKFGTLRVEAGEEGYGRFGLSAGVGLGSGRIDIAGHVRQGEGRFDNEFFDGEELVARGEWEVAPGQSLGLVVRAADADTGIPFSGGLASPRRRISWQERQLALPYRFERGDWQVRAQLSRVTYKNAFRDPDDAFGFTAGDTASEALRARTVAARHQGAGAWIAFGVEWERLEVDDRSVFGSNLRGESQRTGALFAQLRRDIGLVGLEAGLRHDDNSVFGSQTSPRLGVLLRLGRGARLRASYGEAFRAPSIGELFFPLSGNPDLQPETGKSFELGVEQTAGSWRWGLTAFENRLENLIDFDFVSFTNVNVGRARSQGVEVEASYHGDLVSLRWNGTYLEAEDRESGLDLLRRPRESANLVLTLSPGDWVWNLTSRFVGRREDIDPSTFARADNASFVAMDLAVQHRLTERLIPYARIENLLDREYSEVLGFPAPRLTLIGGLALDF